MKNLKTALFLLPIVLLVCDAIAQVKTYPFQVKVSGHGKSNMVLIPGFTCSGDVWKETLTLYESKFTCYTLTMAGFAGVPAQPAPSFASWEAAVVDYIETNHLSKPVIVGHSMGAALALAIASDYPGLPCKIVIVDVLPCLAAMRNPSFKSNPANDCAPVVQQFTAMNDASFKVMQQTGIRQLLTDTTRLNTVVDWSLSSDRATFAMMYYDFLNTDLRDKIKGILCPALVLLEAGFAEFKPAIADQYKNLTTAQLVYATKGLHFIMYDDWSWYRQQLDAFIK
jgi:pimeloyl-ACP methyl ester carboxylesterase